MSSEGSEDRSRPHAENAASGSLDVTKLEDDVRLQHELDTTGRKEKKDDGGIKKEECGKQRGTRLQRNYSVVVGLSVWVGQSMTLFIHISEKSHTHGLTHMQTHTNTHNLLSLMYTDSLLSLPSLCYHNIINLLLLFHNTDRFSS